MTITLLDEKRNYWLGRKGELSSLNRSSFEMFINELAQNIFKVQSYSRLSAHSGQNILRDVDFALGRFDTLAEEMFKTKLAVQRERKAEHAEFEELNAKIMAASLASSAQVGSEQLRHVKSDQTRRMLGALAKTDAQPSKQAKAQQESPANNPYLAASRAKIRQSMDLIKITSVSMPPRQPTPTADDTASVFASQPAETLFRRQTETYELYGTTRALAFGMHVVSMPFQIAVQVVKAVATGACGINSTTKGVCRTSKRFAIKSGKWLMNETGIKRISDAYVHVRDNSFPKMMREELTIPEEYSRQFVSDAVSIPTGILVSSALYKPIYAAARKASSLTLSYKFSEQFASMMSKANDLSRQFGFFVSRLFDRSAKIEVPDSNVDITSKFIYGNKRIKKIEDFSDIAETVLRTIDVYPESLAAIRSIWANLNRPERSGQPLPLAPESFTPGLFDGILSRDLIMMQYNRGQPLYQGVKALEDGFKNEYFIPQAHAKRLHSIGEIMKQCGILSTLLPNHITIAKIPAGELVRFFHGRARTFLDPETGKLIKEGVPRYYFEQFDPSWILRTERFRDNAALKHFWSALNGNIIRVEGLRNDRALLKNWPGPVLHSLENFPRHIREVCQNGDILSLGIRGSVKGHLLYQRLHDGLFFIVQKRIYSYSVAKKLGLNHPEKVELLKKSQQIPWHEQLGHLIDKMASFSLENGYRKMYVAWNPISHPIATLITERWPATLYSNEVTNQLTRQPLSILSVDIRD